MDNQPVNPAALLDLVGLCDDARNHVLDPIIRDVVSGETFLLNPRENKYERIKPMLIVPGRKRGVSNAEALLTVVTEEARRRENPTGDDMTVVFTGNGGSFYPDDGNRNNPDVWEFTRKTSRQLKALRTVLEIKSMDHVTLLQAMASIRFLVIGFDAVYPAMRRVRIDKRMSLDSQPRIEEGKTGSTLNFSFQIEGGQGGSNKASFPAEFRCKLPLISMSTVEYELDVEVEAWGTEKQLLFALRAPSLEAILDQAILAEISTFTAAAKAKLPDLLIVTDL